MFTDQAVTALLSVRLQQFASLSSRLSERWLARLGHLDVTHPSLVLQLEMLDRDGIGVRIEIRKRRSSRPTAKHPVRESAARPGTDFDDDPCGVPAMSRRGAGASSTPCWPFSNSVSCDAALRWWPYSVRWGLAAAGGHPVAVLCDFRGALEALTANAGHITAVHFTRI
jgi:hypothetical protein